MIILDLGSGATCLNDKKVVKRMIDSISKIDNSRHEIIIKFQLFENAPPNAPLKHSVFESAYSYGRDKGYQVTASVFDYSSLKFLQEFDVPFIKIACREDLYPMVRDIDKAMVSYSSDAEMGRSAKIIPLCCVRAYPALASTYEKKFSAKWLSNGISDHTVGFDLYHKYQPAYYEKHVVLEHDDFNPDAGAFSCTPEELEGIL